MTLNDCKTCNHTPASKFHCLTSLHIYFHHSNITIFIKSHIHDKMISSSIKKIPLKTIQTILVDPLPKALSSTSLVQVSNGPNVRSIYTKSFCNIHHYAANSNSSWLFPVRSFSSSSPKQNDKDEYDDDDDDDPDLKKRNKSIRINPNGLSKYILPNDMVYKIINKETGAMKKVHQIAIGSFWMVKDLRETGKKPILSNTSIIPVMDAEMFPTLNGLASLGGTNVNLPDFFIKHDGTSENSCTLVAISYRDFGYKMLSKWTEPFEKSFSQQPSQQKQVSVVHVNITEGNFLKLFSGLLKRTVRNNTPMERHESTLMYFGNADKFRDILRMHNTLTAYLVLVDGLGRVRWMGSGEPIDTTNETSDEKDETTYDTNELNALIQCAKELIDNNDGNKKKMTNRSARVGKKSGRNSV